MEAHLRRAFASALLLSGCGKLGGDLPDCQRPTFAQVSPPLPLDGLEVRLTMQGPEGSFSWDLQRWLESRLSAKERRGLAQEREGAVSQLRARVGAAVACELETMLGLPSAIVADGLFRQLNTHLWNRRGIGA